MYLENEFKTLTLDEYVDILCEILPILPPQTVIHRLTGDAPKRLLVSPLWSADKKNVLNTINRAFAERNVLRAAHTKIPRLNRRQVRIIIACLNTLSCFSEEISIANILFLIERGKSYGRT